MLLIPYKSLVIETPLTFYELLERFNVEKLRSRINIRISKNEYYDGYIFKRHFHMIRFNRAVAAYEIFTNPYIFGRFKLLDHSLNARIALSASPAMFFFLLPILIFIESWLLYLIITFFNTGTLSLTGFNLSAFIGLIFLGLLYAIYCWRAEREFKKDTEFVIRLFRK